MLQGGSACLRGAGRMWLVAWFLAPLQGACLARCSQNSTLMNAPTSWKPTLWYVRLAAVL